jgi:hypothetical protein
MGFLFSSQELPINWATVTHISKARALDLLQSVYPKATGAISSDSQHDLQHLERQNTPARLQTSKCQVAHFERCGTEILNGASRSAISNDSWLLKDKLLSLILVHRKPKPEAYMQFMPTVS